MPSGYVPRKTYPLVGGCVLRRVQASSIRGQFKRSKVGENRSSRDFFSRFKSDDSDPGEIPGLILFKGDRK